jgi:hypothetical protein
MWVKMPIRDYYRVLGLDASASHAEIRAAYRRLAKKFHPDVSKSERAGKRMRLINEAYDVLGDKRKRAIYDYVFLAYGRFQAQEGMASVDPSRLLPIFLRGRFRYIFSRFIVSIVGLQHSLDLVLMSLLVFASAIYVLFGKGELAAVLIATSLFIGAIVLLVRIVAEIFGRAGIRHTEPGFDDIVIAQTDSLRGRSEDREDLY